MVVFQKVITVQTEPRALVDITAEVARVLRESGIVAGTCTAFVQHTSASLVIQENADSAVQRDLVRWLDELAPERRGWEHDEEGPDDMPAHAKSAVTRTSETMPVSGGQLALGTWQGLYVVEHRRRSHARRVHVTVMGVRADARAQ